MVKSVEFNSGYLKVGVSEAKLGEYTTLNGVIVYVFFMAETTTLIVNSNLTLQQVFMWKLNLLTVFLFSYKMMSVSCASVRVWCDLFFGFYLCIYI